MPSPMSLAKKVRATLQKSRGINNHTRRLAAFRKSLNAAAKIVNTLRYRSASATKARMKALADKARTTSRSLRR